MTSTAQTLNGEYRLTGIPETASAFMFTKDGTFEYFFIYGAVDRAAHGTYTIEGDTIKLKSNKEPGKDFLVKSEKKQGKGFTIQVTDPNEYLLSNIVAIYYVDETEKVAYSDSKGRIIIEETTVGKIYLMHQLFPDIASLIKDESNNNNYFEVGLSPSLVYVSFKGIDFLKDGNELTCLPNYIMPFDNIRYVKN